jgi:2-keto-4-pentenoate hydratase/2-oxohepta-3-ene-1,7-dioic acid hydratase in catechol pathway
MKIVRVPWGDHIVYGILDGDRVFALRGDPFGSFSRGRESMAASDARFLIPTVPTKVVCVGRNYTTYSTSGGIPSISVKVPSTWVGHDDPVPYPRLSRKVIMEAELAIVMKRMAKDVPASDALQYVLGYTAANDFTARDIMQEDGRPDRAKNFDGFCPIGPVVETELDPSALMILGRVNGKVEQTGSTKDLIATVPEVISMYSQIMTLFPGDVILTASPTPPPYVSVGDVIEVEVEGIGVLRNRIVEP